MIKKLTLILAVVLSLNATVEASSSSKRAARHLEAVQSYVQTHVSDHSRRAEEIIQSLAWDSIPGASGDLYIKGGAVALVLQNPELYKNGKLKGGAWMETWRVEMDSTVYHVQLVTTVIRGKFHMSYLYTGDLFDSPELWYQKFNHVMEMLSEDDKSFFGKARERQDLFVILKTVSYDSNRDRAVQRLDLYSGGKKISYRVVNESEKGVVITVRFDKLNSKA